MHSVKLKNDKVMNKKRMLQLLFVTLFMPAALQAKDIYIELEAKWNIHTRVPMETPFKVSINKEGKTLCVHFMNADAFTLAIKSLDGQMVYYTTIVNAVSGQDVFIDLKHLPSGTYLLSLENERLEATGYLIL